MGGVRAAEVELRCPLYGTLDSLEAVQALTVPSHEVFHAQLEVWPEYSYLS